MEIVEGGKGNLRNRISYKKRTWNAPDIQKLSPQLFFFSSSFLHLVYVWNKKSAARDEWVAYANRCEGPTRIIALICNKF